MKTILTGLLLSLCVFGINAQSRISLSNPSFEEPAQPSKTPNGWNDCGNIDAVPPTPPDILPGSWEVNKAAQHGSTYLGLVTRDNDTWEGVAQLLSSPMKGGTCYKFSMYLSRSEKYISPTFTTRKIENFADPITVRVWGGNGPCEKTELLATSPLITSTAWKQYTFDLKPKANYKYLFIEAFYKTPTLFPYNGNILVDNLSDLEPCLLADKQKPGTNPNPGVGGTKPSTGGTGNPGSGNPGTSGSNPTTKPVEEGVFSADIKVEKLKEGQIYRIDNLYFPSDSSSITPAAAKVLDELYQFLKKNPKIRIEVGGHTNSLPPDEYCDKLSSNRAKNVANHLIAKGIQASRITYKGYGKRQPIASNDTKDGQKKNQRVEIKILSVE
jgi:outer membrane protein OmpA-like peptidoglycan-associated protein